MSQQVKMMVTISCGCGLVPKNAQEAMRHSQESGHILTMHGQIGPAERLSGVRVVEVADAKK